MAKHFQILPVTQLPADIEALRVEAEREGFRFLDRLVRDWITGQNRFDLAGEQFLGAFSGEALIGVGGLNRDPYAKTEKIGRIRHVYILRAERRHGVGSALVDRLLEEAHVTFKVVHLRTDTSAAAAFYLRNGFVPVADETASHMKTLYEKSNPTD